jgi:hypothetical protein
MNDGNDMALYTYVLFIDDGTTNIIILYVKFYKLSNVTIDIPPITDVQS